MLELNKWIFVLALNFLILLLILNVILFKPLLKIFKEREDTVKQEERNKGTYEWEWNCYKHTKETPQSIVSELLALITKEKSLLEGKSEILEKELLLKTYRHFGTLNEGSSSALSLEMEVNQLQRKELSIHQEMERIRRRLKI